MDYKSIPVVSIITTVYNREDFIENAIKSVLNQTYPKIEYIIIDGKSTDNTYEIIKHFERNISYHISEPDKSMYDGINKGLKVAKGDIIGILNSDDLFYSPKTVELIVAKFNTLPEKYSGIYGDVIKQQNGERKYKKVFQTNYWIFFFSKKGTFIPHPTVFLKRKVVEDIGDYNLRYKYASDFEYLLRVLKKFKLKYLSFPIVIFNVHQNSFTGQTEKTITPEVSKILNEYKITDYSKTKRFFYFAFGWIKYITLNIFYRYLKKISND
jgi:glycosyltransferase involved in cell wall biosynthesis